MVTGTGSGLSAELTAGNYKVLSGISKALGGGDEGPNPHQLIEAALAACTVITIELYARRKGWKLQSTDVKVQILSEVNGQAKILRELFFKGELSAEEKLRLLEIADKCPIHILLKSKIAIDTVSKEN